MRIVPVIAMILAMALGSLTPAVTLASNFSSLEGDPHLRSASALVIDIDGNVIYGKDIDTIRPIASITKLMTAMVIIDSGIDLQEKITVTRDDRDLVQLTGSRLEYASTGMPVIASMSRMPESSSEGSPRNLLMMIPLSQRL